jgi:hypothetical protein
VLIILLGLAVGILPAFAWVYLVRAAMADLALEYLAKRLEQAADDFDPLRDEIAALAALLRRMEGNTARLMCEVQAMNEDMTRWNDETEQQSVRRRWVSNPDITTWR